jgi:hypothetical protein
MISCAWPEPATGFGRRNKLSGGLYCRPESAKVKEYENYFLELSFGVGGLS